MGNCSIPNSSRATGRISTPSSARSKKLNSASEGFFGPSCLTMAVGPRPWRIFNAQRPTLNAQRSIQAVERSVLDVGCWAFSSSYFWGVKGAWWPSRSSKPLSVRKSRGRFDSCPLRRKKFDGRCLISPSFAGFRSKLKPQTFRKEVTRCRASKFGSSLHFHPAPGEQPNWANRPWRKFCVSYPFSRTTECS
jgi:hypothetical protein